MLSTLRPRRRVLVLGFVASLIPLIALLGLQYVWLSRLAKTTAIAHEAALHFLLESVGGEVRHFYRSVAERNLNVPASILIGGDLRREGAAYWASRPDEGIARRFLVDYSREAFGNYYVYDTGRPELRMPPASEESLAMIAACNAWQVLSYWGGRAAAVDPVVDERDPAFRIVVKPITDEEARVIGVAGLIVDATYFREHVLPRVIAGVLEDFFPGVPGERVAVTVRDAAGKIAFTTGALEGDGASVAAASSPPADSRLRHEDSVPFPFVFTDWRVGLASRGRGPEELARATFLSNMTVAGALTLALIGSVFFTLRTADRAVRLSEMKSDFVSNVSHELRTPLSSIRVFGEFLRTGRAADAGTVRRYGRHIEAESRRLSRLIDNVLDFSRIEAGTRAYQLTESSLEEVVETAVDTFQVRLADQGFEIEYVLPPEPLPPVRMDPDAIGQVLHNLLDNAVKYSGDARHVTVTLEREGDHAVCAVRDRGIGIPREERAKVFERFHRAGTGLVHDVQGTGLGLSIVAHVVHAHRGTVDVESGAEQGTVVRVRLPLDAGGSAGGPRRGTG
jgi:signal transduction histidine kinase